MPDVAFTTLSGVALAVGGVAAVGNWVAVTSGHRVVEWVAKPLVMVALIVAACTLHPLDDAIRAWVIAGLVLSLAGDVFLMLPRERFIEGLASFLLAHVAYVVAFALAASSLIGALIGVALAVVAIMIVGRMIVTSVRVSHPELAVPVIGYMGVISAMVVAAWSTLGAWSIVGATSFFASDGILAANKFVRKLPAGRIAVMSTYHVAQFCFVVALVR